MKKYLLVDDIDNSILSEVVASSARSAQSAFDREGWTIGTVMSEEEYLDICKEYELNCLESLSFE